MENTHLSFDVENIPQGFSRQGCRETMVEYYSTLGMDYAPWSKHLNMHFGYFRRGVNPFDREMLLNEMNSQVCQRLSLDDKVGKVIDLGCGVGATTRYCAQHYPGVDMCGITIVPWQIEQANSMTEDACLSHRVHYQLADYCDAPYSSGTFSAAYAIESSCYDSGEDKEAFLSEAYRLLAPGAKLVVADGFRKTQRANRLFEAAYQRVCKGWSLETFANIQIFVETMKKVGFTNIRVEDISWRIAPSVMHIPWVSLKYLWTHILSSRGDRTLQKYHFMAPMMGLLVGLHRKHYGYYLVTGER